MFIAGLGTAAPPQRYAQQECWEAAQRAGQFRELSPRSRAIIKKVLTGNSGIRSRHLVVDDLKEVFELTPDALQARFLRAAPLLATQAAQRALEDAGTVPEEIDALLISTCTGYLCPGLTSYVGERLALQPEVLALDFVGQGCGAALPNLRTAEGLLVSGRCRRVLSICVEICSAAFFLDNDAGVLISACIFGDGAGAAVLANEPNGKHRIEWKQASSLLRTQDRDLLRFESKCGMLRNILSPEVPARAAEHVETVLAQVLNGAGMGREEIQAWLFHPGGRDVLLALRQQLGLTEEQVRWSAAVLAEFGNLSSASLFFVLQEALGDSARPGHWYMSSFGAGFSCHGALLKVD
jgi:alkylresorcinol/alkylpyrone synthase